MKMPDSVLEYCGLNVLKLLDESSFLLFHVTLKEPPPHGDVLRETQVVGERVVHDTLAADQLARRQRHLVVLSQGRAEQWPITRPRSGNRQVEGLRIQPFDGDVQVLFERETHGVVERERPGHLSGLRRKDDGRPGVGCDRNSIALGGLFGDLLEACLIGLLRDGGRADEDCKGCGRHNGPEPKGHT